MPFHHPATGGGGGSVLGLVGQQRHSLPTSPFLNHHPSPPITPSPSSSRPDHHPTLVKLRESLTPSQHHSPLKPSSSQPPLPNLFAKSSVFDPTDPVTDMEDPVLFDDGQRIKSLFSAIAVAKEVGSAQNTGGDGSLISHWPAQHGSPSIVNEDGINPFLEFMSSDEKGDVNAETLEFAIARAASMVAMAVGNDDDEILKNTPLLFPPSITDKNPFLPQRDMSGAFSQIVKFKKNPFVFGAGGPNGIESFGNAPGRDNSSDGGIFAAGGGIRPDGKDSERDKPPPDLLPKVPMVVIVVGSIALVCVLVALGFVLGRRTKRRRRQRRRSANNDEGGAEEEGMLRHKKGGPGGGSGIGKVKGRRRRMANNAVKVDPPPLDLIRRTNAVSRWAASLTGSNISSDRSAASEAERRRQDARTAGNRGRTQRSAGRRDHDEGDDDSSSSMDEHVDIYDDSLEEDEESPAGRATSKSSIRKHLYDPASSKHRDSLVLTASGPSGPPSSSIVSASLRGSPPSSSTSRTVPEPSAPPLLFSLWDYVLGGGAPPPRYDREAGLALDPAGIEKAGDPALFLVGREDSTRSKGSGRGDDDPECDAEGEKVSFSPIRRGASSSETRSNFQTHRLASSTRPQPVRQMSLQKKESSSPSPMNIVTPLPLYPPAHGPIPLLSSTAPIEPSAPPQPFDQTWEDQQDVYFPSAPSPTSSMPAPPPAYTSIRSGAPRSEVFRVADGTVASAPGAEAWERRVRSGRESVLSMGRGVGEWVGIPAWTIEDEMREEEEGEEEVDAAGKGGGGGVTRSESAVLRMLEELPVVIGELEPSLGSEQPNRNRRVVIPSSPRLVAEPM
ncbi:hypothetical protein HDU67_004903 [Dinochytrium kinnereticum]|nr:hypothetical protein HDU67_004903 [Dinochytrium kinnereticum]